MNRINNLTFYFSPYFFTETCVIRLNLNPKESYRFVLIMYLMLRFNGLISVIIFLGVFEDIQSIPIPNGILGAPEIECGANTIDVVFNLQDKFQGKIYVHGYSNDSRCVSQERGRGTTSISIPKDGCGVTTLRSIDPPGLLSNVKVTISFHPLFVTKVDRGFELSCFYMEANKTATYPLIVNTVSLEPLTDVAEMPRCSYEVLEGGPNGQPATVVTVGNPVYHKWNCLSSAPDLWCMTVHSCFVEDGSGTRVEILNDAGCAVDKFILNNLDYPSSLMAGKEAHAFKFADKVFVNFQCSIRLDIKNGECKRPVCPALRKRRRELSLLNETSEHIPYAEIDVRSRSFDVIEPVIDDDQSLLFSNDLQRVKNSFAYHQRSCLSVAMLSLISTICSLISVSSMFAVGYLVWKRRTKFLSKSH